MPAGVRMNLSPETEAAIKAAYKATHSISSIGKHFGIHTNVVRRVCREEMLAAAAEPRAPSRQQRGARLRPLSPRPDELISTKSDGARLAKLIPQDDTRSLTARLMGDPIPGDRRRFA